MRGSCRFGWAAVVAFLLGWAAGLPDPEVRLPSSTRKPQVQAKSLQPFLHFDTTGHYRLGTSPSKTKYARWIIDADAPDLLAPDAESRLDSLDRSLGARFRMQNVMIDGTRHRSVTAMQFMSESAESRGKGRFDPSRFRLTNARLGEWVERGVTLTLFKGLRFTYEDEDLRGIEPDPALAEWALEILNQRQIRRSLQDKSLPGSSAPSRFSVPDISPAGAR